MLLAPAALMAARAASAATKMTLAIHQNTSSGAGYRGSLEGWAKAGIKYVELNNGQVDAFLKTDTLAAARRVLTDNGLTPSCAACGVGGLWVPGANRAAALDTLKRRCETFVELGLTRIYAPSGNVPKFTPDDYKAIPAAMREVGDIASQFKLTVLIEAIRGSNYISTLSTMLRMTREAAHPNVGPLFDFYHFWSGLNKLEDLDMIRPREIGHVHFQDVPDMPREMFDNSTRVIPGDGIAPLNRILRKLSDKDYAGSLSVELFMPKFTQGNPFEVATEIRQKSERVMRQARVL